MDELFALGNVPDRSAAFALIRRGDARWGPGHQDHHHVQKMSMEYLS
jgi:hypothetical protein